MKLIDFLFFFGVYLLAIKATCFAVLEEEEHLLASPRKEVKSSPAIASENLQQIENYTHKLRQQNIGVNRLFIPEENTLKLTFSQQGWFPSLFRKDFVAAFTLLPIVQNISLLLDIPNHSFNKDELKAAVETAKTNISLVGCDVGRSTTTANWDEQQFREQSLLAAFILRNRALRGLITDLGYNFSNVVSNDEVGAITESIKESPSIRKAKLYINGPVEKQIINALHANNRIADLEMYIFGRSLDEEDSGRLAGACLNNSHLTRLVIGCTLNDHLLSQLANVLGHPSSSLQSLALTFEGYKLPTSNLTPENINKFFQALQTNRNLLTLHLRFPISSSSAKTLSESLRSNKALTTLALPECSLNDSFVTTLLEGVKYNPNTTLRTIDLSFNPIAEQSADSIISLLERNNIINNIYLQGTKISSDKSKIIHTMLEKNQNDFPQN